MKFRPCIDIHNGKVKQIVGGSLQDHGNQVRENFVSQQDARYYARLYQEKGLAGGHIILLNPSTSSCYQATKEQALGALAAFKKGMQVGGGITDKNAGEFLDAGASHVIVTSFVFQDGKLNYENLRKLAAQVGKKQLVLDLSCRKRADGYYIVTDRWQKFTNLKITEELLTELADYCDEFLVHAVDVEGKVNGPELALTELLGRFEKIPVTYAGGIVSLQDIEAIKTHGNGRLDFTVGSALDLFGGKLEFEVLSRL